MGGGRVCRAAAAAAAAMPMHRSRILSSSLKPAIPPHSIGGGISGSSNSRRRRSIPMHLASFCRISTSSTAEGAGHIVGGMECMTMNPLHNAIASARLISNIGVNSSSWSWLSQDFAVPR